MTSRVLLSYSIVRNRVSYNLISRSTFANISFNVSQTSWPNERHACRLSFYRYLSSSVDTVYPIVKCEDVVTSAANESVLSSSNEQSHTDKVVYGTNPSEEEINDETNDDPILHESDLHQSNNNNTNSNETSSNNPNESSNNQSSPSSSFLSLPNNTNFSTMNLQQLTTIILQISLSNTPPLPTLTSLMHATSSLHSASGAKLTERLLFLSIESSSSTVELYNIAIDAWAKSKTSNGFGAKRAMELLDLMHSEYSNSPLEAPKPDVINYSTVLSAWSKSGVRDAPYRAEALLRDMEHFLLHPNDDNDDTSSNNNKVLAGPDTICYNTVLSTWANSHHHTEAPERAEHLLSRLKHLYHHQKQHPSLKPNTQSYSAVIHAYALQAKRTRSKKAAHRAEQLLHELHTSYIQSNDDSEVRPDRIVFNSVLNALSKADLAQRAEQLLEHMHHLQADADARGDTIDVRPNRISYNTVLHGWARLGFPKEVERLLSRMIHQNEEEEEEDVRPDTVSYNCLIDAFAKCRQPLKAQEVLEYLLTTDDGPNAISFATVIHAWSQQDDFEGPLRAYRVLQMALKQYETRQNPIPNIKWFQGVVTAYANQRKPAKAEWILMEMMEFRQTHNLMSVLRPTTYLVNIVLQAWAREEDDQRTKTPDYYRKAYRLLQRMEQSRSRQCRPDGISYNAVLMACASASVTADCRTQEEVLEIAMSVYHRLLKERNNRMTSESYRSILKVVLNRVSSDTGDEKKEKVELLRDIVQSCCQNGLLRNDVWMCLTKGIDCDDDFLNIVGKDRKVDFEDLPRQWSRRVTTNEDG